MGKTPRKVRIFSALEVANLCGVVNQTAINWIRNGHLKAFMTPGGQYRVYTEDLLDFLKGRNMRVPEELESATKSDVDWSTIAIIDDDRLLNDVVRKFFQQDGFGLSVVQAYDGFEAGVLLAEKRPGFVILDIDLPGHDGNELCRKLKTAPVFGKPFVITITGLEGDDVRESAIAAGSDAFFSKPLNLDALGTLITDFAAKVRT